MSLKDQDRENIFHERVSILKDQGYRGFSVSKINRKWDGVRVTVENGEGKTLSASGETIEEAYHSVIGSIDRFLD